MTLEGEEEEEEQWRDDELIFTRAPIGKVRLAEDQLLVNSEDASVS